MARRAGAGAEGTAGLAPVARLIRCAVAILGLLAVSYALPACAAQPSTADLDAAARAAGNRSEEARAIGRALFGTVWPAQITKVRVDGVGGHLVAGLVLSGVKFHGAFDRAALLREVEELMRRAFAAAPVEEIDLWVTVPIPYDKREPVSGDYAQPVTRPVFAVSCRRGELAGFAGRLRSGDGVFWAPDFLRSP